ncbi:ABC transporter permease [Staphylococcus simulans]|uniref:ABC transporter permease n=1 Tax=Staphylococcus simulans TaxID=1286 RepID=UPI000D03E963|nr:ABC transporter permease [Staphylococcus simulans]
MILSYLKLDWSVTLRQKVYLLLSIGLPLAFFLLFTAINDVPKAQQNQVYKEILFNMTTFSLTSFSLMTFPTELLLDKQNGWQKKLFATPMTPAHYYLAKVLKMMSLFVMTIVLIFIVGATVRDIEMPASEWLISGLLLWIGSSLFLSIGLLIAQSADIKQAGGIGNLLYIGLAITGGLWFPTELFPKWLEKLSYYTPTYQLKHLGLEFVQDQTINFTALGFLSGYCILFIILALAIQKKTDVV